MKKSPIKRYQQGGTVAGSEVPEEQGPAGLRYNRLLAERRQARKRERDADELLPTEARELSVRRSEGNTLRGPSNEQLAERAARMSARHRNRVADTQFMQRHLERELDKEGARIGQRRDATRVEDNGYKKGGVVGKTKKPAFKKGGKVAMKKGKQ